MLLWWANLSGRERLLVIGGGLLVALCLLYVALLEPLQQERARLATQVSAEQRVLTELGSITDQIARHDQTTGAAAAFPTEQTLLGVLNQSAARLTINEQIKRIVPAGERQATVTFTAVSFDRLTDWLAELHAQYGIEVLRITIERTQTPGIVNTNLTVTRS